MMPNNQTYPIFSIKASQCSIILIYYDNNALKHR